METVGFILVLMEKVNILKLLPTILTQNSTYVTKINCFGVIKCQTLCFIFNLTHLLIYPKCERFLLFPQNKIFIYISLCFPGEIKQHWKRTNEEVIVICVLTKK